MLVNILKLVRVKQWVKNLLVFAPLIFAQELLDLNDIYLSLLTFVSFCLVSSSVYVLNDLEDVMADKQHPVKKHRPLASGDISVGVAQVIAFLFGGMGLFLSIVINLNVSIAIGLYFALIFAYSRWLKKQVIVDVLVVSLGFVLRALAGALAIRVEFSAWLLVTTLFLALFLALGKRRHELILLGDNANHHRAIYNEYSEHLLDQLIVMVGTASLISYTLYTLSTETLTKFKTTDLVYTLPIVVYGLFRYFYLIYRRDKGGDPTSTLYTDIPLLLSVGLWAFLVVVIIYS